MKFIHVADIHASRERLPQTLSILNTLTERCKQGDINFILFAGDFWDSTITATKGSGFSDIISAIRKLERYTYLYFIYGTPTHEPCGSLDAFASDKSRIINCNIAGFDVKTFTDFVFIPEPRRSNYIGKSAKEIDDTINKELKKFIKSVDKKSNSPLIVVYHGEVKGAVYQNGVYASSPTAIPKELLQSLNADYYAFGHIHMPQEVFKNGWYSGSACPKNFGETHDGHYNLVTIENGETKVEEVSFGLPVYETYDMFYSDFAKTKRDFTNKHIRLQFDCTKEQRKSLNIKQIADDIKKRTNALSVKLEPNVIDGETVQQSKVVKHKSIVEKMSEYAKEKGLRLPKYAKELLQNIQDNTLAKLAYPQHSFELLSLSLRGAIGIRNGQHKEDFELNFEQYEDGVICLIGDNGHGKSTLIENCHPYPCMLSREGTLKEHFYLKDSHRILVYKDENELYYRISMLIDGRTANGKASYYVKTSKDREVWNTLPDVDGSKESYDEWVEQTFGSKDVFLRTAFFAKEQTKGIPDISATTKSERMELLSKLAGTDHLKEVSMIAREARKDIEKNYEKLETEIEAYSHYDQSIKENEQDIISWNNELKGQNEAIVITEQKLNELREKNIAYQKVKAVSEANCALRKQYHKEYEETKVLYDKFDEAVNNAILFDKVDSSNKVIVTNAPLITDLMERLDKLNKKIAELTDNIIETEKEASEKKLTVSKIEADIKLCKSQIIEVEEVCPTCGQPISEHKKNELLSHVNQSKEELTEFESVLKQEREVLSTLNSMIETKEKERDALADERTMVESSLADLQSESKACAEFIENLDKIYSEQSYDDVVEEHITLSKELDELRQKLDELADDNELEDVSDELAETEKRYRFEQNRCTELSAMIKSAEKELERYQKELEAIEEKKAKLKELTEKVTAYNFIEDAFSNNGIPAIELRESAPEIADIANKILADSYGNKFEIRFGSTSELKAKRKANEDFNIIVYDTENGDEKTIDLVSSGERIWIKQALFYAFSIVQMNRTGFNFRTRLIDESDGSLDGGLRPKYLQMVESAHKQACSRVTLLITHSQEIKDIAQQIIEI